MLFFIPILCHPFQLFLRNVLLYLTLLSGAVILVLVQISYLCVVFLPADIYWYSSCVCQPLQRAGYLHSDTDAALSRGELL